MIEADAKDELIMNKVPLDGIKFTHLQQETQIDHSTLRYRVIGLAFAGLLRLHRVREHQRIILMVYPGENAATLDQSVAIN